jgi:nucleotide-binding universal stress UspA family protein
MKTILAAIDFSPVSEEVVKTAAGLAQATHGQLVLFTVVQPPVMLGEYASYANVAEITAAGEKNAERDLAKFAEQLAADFVSVETLELVGSPIPLILEQAEKYVADYIVMGSHGHGAFYDLLVGSTTNGVLTGAACPVVIVPAKKIAPAKKTQRARETVP